MSFELCMKSWITVAAVLWMAGVLSPMELSMRILPIFVFWMAIGGLIMMWVFL